MNSNTIVNALHASGLQENQPVSANLPLSGIPVLFTDSNQNPITLNIPATAAQGSQVAPLFGGASERVNWFADGHPFRVRASGLIVPNSPGNFLTLKLQYGTGLGADAQTMFSIQSILPSVQPYATNWGLEGRLMWDSTSSSLCGVVDQGWIGVNNFSGNAVTRITGITGSTPLHFVLAASMNVNGGVATLTEFSAEML